MSIMLHICCTCMYMQMYLILYVYLVMRKKCFPWKKCSPSVMLGNCVMQVIENILSKWKKKIVIYFCFQRNSSETGSSEYNTGQFQL